MKGETALQPSAYEQALINIVRTLPVERILQILLYYARYIQSQTIKDFVLLDEEETEINLIRSELSYSILKKEF